MFDRQLFDPDILAVSWFIHPKDVRLFLLFFVQCTALSFFFFLKDTFLSLPLPLPLATLTRGVEINASRFLEIMQILRLHKTVTSETFRYRLKFHQRIIQQKQTDFNNLPQLVGTLSNENVDVPDVNRKSSFTFSGYCACLTSSVTKPKQSRGREFDLFHGVTKTLSLKSVKMALQFVPASSSKTP